MRVSSAHRWLRNTASGQAPLGLDMAMIFHDVRGVCSIAGNTAGQPVPAGINGDPTVKIASRRVWSTCGHRSERPAVTPRVNPGYSLPPRVNPQVAKLVPRALVAQGIEQRFPKPPAFCAVQPADLRVRRSAIDVHLDPFIAVCSATMILA
jgi:hypothetical protein